MTQTAPLWSLVDRVSNSEPAEEITVSLEDIEPHTGRLLSTSSSVPSVKGTPFCAGDILFGKLRPYLGKHWLANRSGIALGDIHVYRPRAGVDSHYVDFIIGDREFVRFAEAVSKGTKMPRAEWGELQVYLAPKYSLADQQRIADYLNHETGAIDSMVEKLDVLESALKNRMRQNINDELYPRYTSEDSTPTAPLWRFADINPPTHPMGTVTFMPLDAIWPGKSADYSRTISGQLPSSYTRFRFGDILVPKITPTFEAGRTLIAHPPTEFGFASTEVHVIRVRGANDARFLGYIFRSTAFLEAGAYALQGVGNLRRVSSRFMHEWQVPDVSPETQSCIADRLDELSSRTDAMLTKVAKLRSLLVERRAALITEVITGRKDIA